MIYIAIAAGFVAAMIAFGILVGINYLILKELLKRR